MMWNLFEPVDARLTRWGAYFLGTGRFATIAAGLIAASQLCPQTARAAVITFTAADSSAPPSSPVVVPVSVNDFNDVLLFQFTIEWNPSIVQFSSVANLANLPGFTVGNFGTGSTGSGRLTVSWDDGDLSGEDLANGAKLFDINFTTLGGIGSSTPVQFTDNPTPRLVGVNMGGTVTPATFAQDDGSITVVPEPVNTALGVFGAILAGGMIGRRFLGKHLRAS